MTARPLTTDEGRVLLAPMARLPRVALAVSGGPDSVALLHLAATLRTESVGPELHVLTVDHALRDGSADEAALVSRIAEGYGLAHETLTWVHKPVDAGVQARARAARYDLMAAYCSAHRIAALVTAHHLDDQAETFLMRLKRGSGLDGLAAIPAEGAWAGIPVLRPLLGVSKARLVVTVEAAGLSYVSDPSNEDARFERSRLRGAVDALAALGLDATEIALSARRLRRAHTALEAATDAFLACHGETSAVGYGAVASEALLAAPEEVALRALSRLIGTVGGSADPVRLAKLEALLDSLARKPATAQTLGRCRIVPKDERFYLFREIRKEGLPALTLKPGEQGLWDNRFRIMLGAGASAPVTVKALGDEGFLLLREREGLPAVPRLAAETLPSCWRGSRLLGLPRFSNFPAPSSRHEGGLDCDATFLRGVLL
jgi:tRNA(Ile)-lysidine synthase